MVSGKILVALVMALVLVPGMASAALIGNTSSSVSVQANGGLFTDYSVYSISGSSTIFESGYFEETFATNGEIVYMNNVGIVAPNIVGESNRITTNRAIGFNLEGMDQVGSISSSEMATVSICGAYPLGGTNESLEQMVYDRTTVYNNLIAANSLIMESQNEITNGVTPVESDFAATSIANHVEAIGSRVGYGTVGARVTSVAGIDNTTRIGHVEAFDQRASFRGDFAIESSFTRDLLYRPTPQELSIDDLDLCIFS